MAGSEDDAEAKHEETGNKGEAAELEEKPGRHKHNERDKRALSIGHIWTKQSPVIELEQLKRYLFRFQRCELASEQAFEMER